MAGLAAAAFAADCGLETTVIGQTAEIIFASGLIDLLGVHPIEEKRIRENPWSALSDLVRDQPEHPYAKLTPGQIADAIDGFLGFLEKAGLPYRRQPAANAMVLTPMGTPKPTYAVPHSMWAGAAALKKKTPCRIVGFYGLKGFSARLIAETMHRRWPALEWENIAFPDSSPGQELFAESIARRLDSASVREQLAGSLKPRLNGVQALGVPAVLGLYNAGDVFADLNRRLGIPLFEIPTMPPSAVGLRTKEALLKTLAAKGVQVLSEQKVRRAVREPDGGFVLTAASESQRHTIRSRAVILAGGRFLGGGLRAKRKRICEPLFDLPVHQAPERASWHRNTFLDPRGHPINRAGLETDDFFRPLGADGAPAHPALFAAGSILAHQDWMRQKCGAGLAVSTAWGAVNACRRLMGGNARSLNR